MIIWKNILINFYLNLHKQCCFNTLFNKNRDLLIEYYITNLFICKFFIFKWILFLIYIIRKILVRIIKLWYIKLRIVNDSPNTWHFWNWWKFMVWLSEIPYIRWKIFFHIKLRYLKLRYLVWLIWRSNLIQKSLW